MEYDFLLEEIIVYYEKSYFGKFVYDVEIKFWKNEYFVVKEV